jgi:DNA-binding CsgD family transcriptional regulator/tetratricopeptide (TPR) repeat protein
MLETLREYALERLAEHDDPAALRRRHLEYFLALAGQAEPELFGAQQRFWLDRLELEHDNLRAALRWTGERGLAESGLYLAAALWRFWEARGHFTEGRRWLEQALAQAQELEPTRARAKALNAAGRLAFRQGDMTVARAHYDAAQVVGQALGDRRSLATSLHGLGLLAHNQREGALARSLLEQSLAMQREVGDRWGSARSLYALGQVAQVQGDYASGRALYEESLAISRALGDQVGIAWSLNNLGIVARSQGDFGQAQALYEASLAAWRELGDRLGVASGEHNLGILARLQGDYETARLRLEESLTRQRELGNRRSVALAQINLATVARLEGDTHQATELAKESLTTFWDMCERTGTVECLAELAALAGAEGQPELASRLFGAVEALREASSLPIRPADRAAYDRTVARVRDQMDAAAFAAAWATGRQTPLAEAVQDALNVTWPAPGTGRPLAAGARGEPAAALTADERDVARLIGRGVTNRQIAEQLAMTEHAVGSHLGSILAKLGFQTREQVADWTKQHGLE